MRLEYKAFPFTPELVQLGTEEGHFTGKASVYGVVDRGNDKVMPGAFTKSLGESGPVLPLLNAHDPKDSIGLVTLEDSTEELRVKDATLALELQSAKDTHIRLKRGLVRGLSIGYQTVKAKSNKGIRELHEIKLHEISVVAFPMLTSATVTSVKSDLAGIADDLRAGRMTPDVKDFLAGAFGTSEALRLEEKAAASLGQRIEAVYQAARDRFGDGIMSQGPYVKDVYDGYAVLCKGAKHWRVPVTFKDDGTADLGEAVEVRMPQPSEWPAADATKDLQDLLAGVKNLARNI